MKTPFRAQKADSLIAPFSRDVWFVILASCILMGPLLYLFVAHLEPRAKTVPTTERYSLKNCYWFVYGALLKQGSSLDPSSDVARILFASWWLFIQVITSFYTAELTAVLTLSQSELPVQNMEQLRYREGAKWVAIDGAEMAILQKDESFQYLTQEIADGKGFLVNSVEEALERVLNDDDTYFLTDKAFAESYVFNDHRARYSADREQARQEGCRLSVAPGFEFGSLPYGLMLRKGNRDLNEKINGIIDQLSLSGILEYLENEKRPLSDLHTVCTLDDDKTLIVQDLISTFLLVILGYAVSTLVLTSELLFPKCLKGRFGTIRPSSNDQCMYPQDEDRLERRMISVNGKKSSVNIIGHK
ncbi:glutamate receptor ionotropic, kainate glr-3-like [Tigriopus californicus]|uniref:glutamate receptor ionotropic, kainate glr-3-like n=1 Tax=Tigriopus californicus TaxID=6832 RepID=UPI0027DA84A4|nr:glutamate receptor ionotropic, kainate glr-3-like [Tigriopus californicus]